jgi:hypothetical protein
MAAGIPACLAPQLSVRIKPVPPPLLWRGVEGWWRVADGGERGWALSCRQGLRSYRSNLISAQTCVGKPPSVTLTFPPFPFFWGIGADPGITDVLSFLLVSNNLVTSRCANFWNQSRHVILSSLLLPHSHSRCIALGTCSRASPRAFAL